MITTETLNWADMDSLIQNPSALNPIQSGLLLNARNQIEGGYRWKNTIYGSYEKNASFIAVSNWKKSSRYIKCGMPSTHGRVFCNEHEYCDFCAWKKGKDVYSKLKPAYGRAEYWYHITYAYTSNVDLTSASKADYLSKYKEGFSYIQKLISEDVILGAYAVAEYSINSLTHALVYPHVHALVCSDHPLIEAGTHHAALEEYKGQGVSLHVTEIENSKQYERVINYSSKPIDLKKIYETEVDLYPVQSVNNGINVVLTKTSELEYRFAKVRYFGILDSRKKSYIGLTDPNKVDNRTKSTKKKKLKVVGVSNTMVAMDVKSTTQFNLHMAKAAAAPVTVNGTPVSKSQKPSLFRRILPYAAGATALAGGAYLADKYYNNSGLLNKGVNWMADKLTPESYKADQRAAIMDMENRARVRPFFKQFNTDMAPVSTAQTAANAAVPAVANVSSKAEQAGGLVMMKNYIKSKLPTAKGVPPLLSKPPLINPKLIKPLAVAGGVADAATGYQMAQDPMLIEGYTNPERAWYNPINSALSPVSTFIWNKINNGDPERARKVLSTAGLGLGASSLIKHPFGLASYPAALVSKEFLDIMSDNQRLMASNLAANDVGSELLLNLYRGARSGDVNYTQALRRWLEAHQGSPITQEPAVAALIRRAQNL